MNKYIKKCLVVYSALALILVGMAGVTYAITATDADNYVTRSQYAVDMAYLQNKMDEAEAGLMGNINRYRSTDVKFVTYDTPTYPGTNQTFSGGNFLISRRTAPGSENQRWCHRGISHTNTPDGWQAKYRYYTLHRLWNGNYYLTTDKVYRTTDSSSNYYYHGAGYNCAVPCENLPGYYLVIAYYGNNYSSDYAYSAIALHKLDPSVAPLTAAQITAAGYLKFRFKKDLWQYRSDKVTDANFPVAKGTNISWEWYQNLYGDPLQAWYYGQRGASQTAYTSQYGWSIDPDTGDYILEVNGLRQAYAWSAGCIYYKTDSLMKLIPKDNVEYLMAGTVAYCNNYDTSINSASPSTRYISTGENTDAWWQHEIVDCENGIKYLHSYKPALSSRTSGTNMLAYGWHYSLPIVY